MFKRHTFCVMYNLFVFGCFVMVPCAANEENKASTLLNQGNEDNDQQVNCSIQLAEESINHELILKIQEGVNLIYIQLDFESGDDMAKRGMYQPLRWMQVQDDTGMEILKYDERRQILSMTMLKNVFSSTTISLIERPSRCLSNLSNEMYERKIRNFLLLGMKDAKEHDLDYKNIQDGVNICHLKLRDEPFLQFYFSCCQITPRRHKICKDEIPSKSSELFSLPLYLLIAFLPLLLAFKMGVTSLKLDIHSFTEDVEFISGNQGCVVSIPRTRLICSDEGPINFPDLLYERIILCKCKDQHAIFCCEQKIHGQKDWGTFLRKVTKFWKLHMLFIVFIFRSTLYLVFEYPEEKNRHEFIREKSSLLNDQRNLFYFICLGVSFPVIFIISIYNISKEATKNIKIFLHKSMLDLKEIPFDRFLSWSIYILFLLVPTHGKVKSLIAFPFYLIIGIPFCVALVFLCIVPLNRMMLYFLLNFFPLDLMKRQFPFLDILKLEELYGNFRYTGLQIFSLKRKNLRPRKLLHLIGFSLFLSLLLYSYIFLTIVCIQFVMMLVIYNIIGAIEDWDRYLAYLVFGSWIMIYSHKSWNSYREMYKIYNREIHNLLLNLISERLQSISLSKHTEDNLLILCIPDSKNNKRPILIDNEKIDVPQMTIFFDQKSKSYILRDTFIDFMNSEPFGDKKVESKPFSHFISFVFISLFILLMFLITQKFLKGSNQIVVMLVTGVIPWIYDRYTGTSGHHVRILDSVEQIKKNYQEELDRLISKRHILKCSFPEKGKSQQEDGFIEDDDNDDYNDDDGRTQSLHEYSPRRQGYQRIADSEC